MKCYFCGISRQYKLVTVKTCLEAKWPVLAAHQRKCCQFQQQLTCLGHLASSAIWAELGVCSRQQSLKCCSRLSPMSLERSTAGLRLHCPAFALVRHRLLHCPQHQWNTGVLTCCVMSGQFASDSLTDLIYL